MEEFLKDIEKFEKSIIDALGREFETIWMVDANDGSMHIYRENKELSVQDCGTIVSELNNYSKAQKWYIDNFVVSEQKDRLYRQTMMDVVVKCLFDKEIYYVDYKRLKDNRVNYNQILYMPIGRDESGNITHFVIGFRDMDVSRRAEMDDLTGIYTRRAFIRHATEVLRLYPEERFDLILSDIVDFKQINEMYGIKVGDEILKWGADQIHGLRSEKVIVGRYGGDQFVMLGNPESFGKFDEAGESDYSTVTIGGMDYHLRIKYGICQNVNHDTPVVTLCDNAHVALNSIKHDYSRRVAVYSDRVKNNLSIQRVIEDNMRSALVNSEFKVFYQPKHDAVTGELVGAEALIRWINPTYGFMSPAEFIPVFERTGFVTEADMYVWKRTCENINRWQSDGIEMVPISVNASRADFREGVSLKAIDKIARDNNVDPKFLHVEVTESMMEENAEAMIATLNELRQYGYHIELDDFGTGYSSINVLSTLPMDVIKLDMCFVKQIEDPRRRKVLEACINLAKNLGYITISEGVETLEQLHALKSLGVDIIQGFYYSKPLPEDEFENYLKENRMRA